MARIGSFAVRYRYALIILWLVATALALRSLPSLGSVANGDNSQFLPASAPVEQALELAAPFQPAGLSTATLVAVRANGPLTAADQAAISAAEQAVATAAHVTGVRDQGVSGDGRARKAQVAVNITASSPQAGKTVDGIRSAVADVHAPAGLTLDLTGPLAINADNQNASQHAQQLTQIGANLIILVMLLLLFRSPVAALITLAPAFLVLQLSGRLIAQAASAGLQVSSFTQIILTVLVLGAGTDYGLFLMLRVREELRRGLSPSEAIVHAVARVGESISFSAGIVVGSLLCLLVATFGVYHGLGPALAIGIALMLLAALTLLPALLASLGRAAFWPAETRSAPDRPGSWGSIAGHVVVHPIATLAAGVVLFGGLSVAVLGYAPGGFAGTTSGPSGSQSAAGQNIVQAHYPIAVSKPTGVLLWFPTSRWTNLAVAQQAEIDLGKQPVFRAVSGLLDPNGTAVSADDLARLYAVLGPPALLPPAPGPSVPVSTTIYNAYRSTAQFISADGRTLQFDATLAAGDPAGTAALQAVPAIRAAVDQVARQVGAIQNGVTGQAAASYDVSAASDTDLTRIIPIVLVLIAILLALVLRSLVAPLYLVASVALSYGASLGLAVLLFMHAGGAAGLNFVLPFLMFIFLMALGEDYNILVMSRIREEARETSLPEAVTRALAATGTTITSAGLILAATFGVAGLAATTDQTRQLTLSIAIGILLDTFLVRTLLVPSVVALLGRWNWWPSRLAGPTARGHVDDTDAPQARRLEAPIPTQAAFATTPQRRPGQSDS